MRSPRKVDARSKINGSHKFIDDYIFPDMIYGYLYYARCHHGYIRKITFPEEFDLKNFIIIDYKDIPGRNIVPEPEPDQPFLVENEVYHYGQIIMGIAHPNKAILKQFVEKIEIEYEELTALTDIKECLEDESNAFGREIIIDQRQSLEPRSEWIKTSAVYYTAHQEQAYLETQGMIAIYNQDQRSIYVLGTMQCPYFVKEAVEMIMGDKITEVVIETAEGIGGAFGGKEDFPNILAGVASLLAYKAEKPVKIVLERSDDIVITTKRHPSRVEIETYTDPVTNKIRKLKIDYRLDAGGYLTLSPVVLSRGVLHSFGGYNIRDVFIHGRLLRSNTPSNGAFRGFGAPQAFFAIESHIDKIAGDLKIDPLELRMKNILQKDDRMPTTQIIREDHILDCLNRVIEKSDYKQKYIEFQEYNQHHDNKKGIGISICFHGGGYTGNGEKVLQSKVKMTIEKDAAVNIYVANTDMGQGAHTTLAQMVSETLDHPLNKTRVVIPNTSKTPNSGPTVASRTIYIIGNLLCDLSLQIKKEIQGNLDEYVRSHNTLFPKEYSRCFTPDPTVVFDDKTYLGTGYKDYSWAACVCEVFYQTSIFKLDLKKIWTVLDIGIPVNPKIAEGQVEGGLLQAMGYALTEYFYKPDFGRMHGFTDYILPTTLDTPEMDIEFIHTDSDFAKGLGEIPMNYPAPAIRNAFHHATGIFIDEIPLTPERIYENIKGKS